MELNYQKLHGCQNDYLYFDLRGLDSSLSSKIDWKQASVAFSDRQKGVGSDGVILLLPPEQTDKADVRMQMFNADGSEAEMCGNGLRCVAKLVYDGHGGTNPRVRVETKAGLRECEIVQVDSPQRCLVRANMGRPNFLPPKVPVLFDDVMVMDEEFVIDEMKFQVSCLSMGNPHTVIEVMGLEKFEVGRFGPQIEKHPAFPEGTNVEFVEVKGMEVHQRTWERGSGETKACGTGACAAAVTLIMRNRIDSPVMVVLQGGGLLIEWDGLREVWMTGEAEFVSEGKLDFSAYL
jgi:diaminopimelate epimerase